MSLRLRLFRDERVRFLMVGCANTVFATLLFALLLHSFGRGVPSTASLCIAAATSLLTGFLAQRWLVFRVKGQIWQDLVRYTSVTYAMLLMNVVAMAVLADAIGLPPIPVQIGIAFITAVFNYFSHKYFSFRRRR